MSPVFLLMEDIVRNRSRDELSFFFKMSYLFYLLDVKHTPQSGVPDLASTAMLEYN